MADSKKSLNSMLKEKAEEYARDKAVLDALTKKCDANNKEIKYLMKELKLEEFNLEDGSVLKYSMQTRSKINDDKMILLLRELVPDTECIKTKEYVDTDVLESEIYHEKISPAIVKKLAAGEDVKEIPLLTLKRGKKK